MTGDTLDLEPIKAREAAAVKGPWTNGSRPDDKHMGKIVARGYVENPNIAGAVVAATWDHQHAIVYVGLTRQQTIDNAEFIAHARQDIPALIAEVERLRAALHAGRSPSSEVDGPEPAPPKDGETHTETP